MPNTSTIGIIMNGITGRVGQKHLAAIRAIRAAGGVRLATGHRLLPEPTLVGRNPEALEALGQTFGFAKHTTDLCAALGDEHTSIYFDALVPTERPAAIHQALRAGKHIYAEKPLATSFEVADALARTAQASGLKHGLVQNLLFQPGVQHLEQLVRSGFFGRILNVKIDFGYWVFEGDWQPAQRPSWNYRRATGGGMTIDMFPHWNGLIERLFGPVRRVTHQVSTHIPQRFDEHQQAYAADTDDAAHSLLELENGTTVQINASWATRVYRDEFLSVQVDGTHGSAVAGYQSCKVQHRVNTPRSSAMLSSAPPQDGWQALPESPRPEPFQAQWECFLRAVAGDEAFPWDFFAAARGLRLAETALQSSLERRWLEVNPPPPTTVIPPSPAGEPHA